MRKLTRVFAGFVVVGGTLTGCASSPYANFLESVHANSPLSRLYTDQTLADAGQGFCDDLASGTMLRDAVYAIDGPMDPAQAENGGGYSIRENWEVVEAIAQSAGWNISDACHADFVAAGGQPGTSVAYVATPDGRP